MFSSLTQHYDALVSAIIRPPREVYTISDLGPRRGQVAGLPFERVDVELSNPRGLKLACSHFIPFGQVNRSFPCVIYMHGNSSSRMEALSSLALLLSLPATVFCFDFSGSGISDGSFVSLGYWEKDDLSTVVDYLRSLKTVDCIGLWGRSMGAVTALLHADRDPSLAGLVLDSPFTNLRLLAKELVESGRYVNAYISSWLVDVVLSFMKGTIEEKANFDIDQLVPIDHVGQTFVPALFAAGDKDTFIYPHHAKELFDAYAGEDKLWYTIKGNDHNTIRPDCFLQQVAAFFWRALQCDQREPINPPRRMAGLEELPPNIRRIRSRSRPGEYTYEDVQTGQRYASLLQAQRVAARVSESDASDEGGAPGDARPQGQARKQRDHARKIANEFMIFRTWTTEDLVNLGFSRDKSEEATKRCKSLSLESAVAWLCDSDQEE
eukprot:GEMP01026783.1.p1 GENE.GEMP01026783.1~~GEMP01026783.1.p1  ORF type:complete len:436 (+),score=82.31 GEMP01026783.1:116-1423(+)